MLFRSSNGTNKTKCQCTLINLFYSDRFPPGTEKLRDSSRSQSHTFFAHACVPPDCSSLADKIFAPVLPRNFPGVNFEAAQEDIWKKPFWECNSILIVMQSFCNTKCKTILTSFCEFSIWVIAALSFGFSCSFLIAFNLCEIIEETSRLWENSNKKHEILLSHTLFWF